MVLSSLRSRGVETVFFVIGRGSRRGLGLARLERQPVFHTYGGRKLQVFCLTPSRGRVAESFVWEGRKSEHSLAKPLALSEARLRSRAPTSDAYWLVETGCDWRAGQKARESDAPRAYVDRNNGEGEGGGRGAHGRHEKPWGGKLGGRGAALFG